MENIDCQISEYYCELCNMHLHSERMLEGHWQDKDHKSRLKRKQKQRMLTRAFQNKEDDSIPFGIVYRDKEFHCKICGCQLITYRDVDTHTSGQRHKNNKDLYRQGIRLSSRLERLLKKFSPVIGLEFVTEHISSDQNDLYHYYRCNICKNKGTEDDIICHIIGINHKIKILKSFNEIEYKKLTQSNLPTFVLHHTIDSWALEIEKTLGRGNPTIRDEPFFQIQKDRFTKKRKLYWEDPVENEKPDKDQREMCETMQLESQSTTQDGKQIKVLQGHAANSVHVKRNGLENQSLGSNNQVKINGPSPKRLRTNDKIIQCDEDENPLALHDIETINRFSIKSETDKEMVMLLITSLIKVLVNQKLENVPTKLKQTLLQHTINKSKVDTKGLKTNFESLARAFISSLSNTKTSTDFLERRKHFTSEDAHQLKKFPGLLELLLDEKQQNNFNSLRKIWNLFIL